uniref:Uncharacterized protein n=1 Tax=Oryza punctata TaxID=4537 RepID=A0A0E0KWH0_ORYPU
MGEEMRENEAAPPPAAEWQSGVAQYSLTSLFFDQQSNIKSNKLPEMSAYRCRPAISIQDSGHQLCRQSVTAELGDLWWWWGFARGDGDDESRGKLNPVTSHPLCY